MTVDNAALESTSQLVDEKLDLGVRDIAKMYGSNCHRATIQRHIKKGCKLDDGTTLRLEAVCIGGSYRTSKQAVLRFLAALSARGQRPPESPTPAQLSREAAVASAQLESILGGN